MTQQVPWAFGYLCLWGFFGVLEFYHRTPPTCSFTSPITEEALIDIPCYLAHLVKFCGWRKLKSILFKEMGRWTDKA